MNELKSQIVGVVVGLLCASGLAQADYQFSFSGEDDGGIGSATMGITINDKTLTATLENTSPVDLIGGSSGGNSPGISAFGFDLDPETLGLLSWQLTGKTTTGTDVTIGSSSTGAWDWEMGTFLQGVTLDYLPNNGGVVDGALFNPLAIEDENNELPGGANDTYFTTAILTMTFDENPTLVTKAYVRMQNVGRNGDGSLKMYGDGSFEPGPPTVPVPAPLALLGVGGLMIGWRARKSLN